MLIVLFLLYLNHDYMIGIIALAFLIVIFTVLESDWSSSVSSVQTCSIFTNNYIFIFKDMTSLFKLLSVITDILMSQMHPALWT